MTNLSERTAHLTPQQKRVLLAELLRQRAKLATPSEIPIEYYSFEHSPEYLKLKQQQLEIAQLGISNPFFTPQEGVSNNTTIVGGRELINYATYNYIGMSGDPVVSQAAKEAIDLAALKRLNLSCRKESVKQDILMESGQVWTKQER